MTTTTPTLSAESVRAAPSPRRRTRPRLLGSAAVRVAVVVIAALWSMPTVGLLISSLRHPTKIQTSGWWDAVLHPFESAQWTVSNYTAVLDAGGMGNAFLNTMTVTVPATVIPITIAAFAAYAFAWMRFPGKQLLFGAVIALLVVPLHVALIPILRLYTDWGLTGTFLGTWLAHTGFGLPLATYLLYSYIAQLPQELMEAAKVDGASHFRIFRRIVLPLSVPAIAAFAIFQFLWVWNDLLVALVYLGTDSDVGVLTARLASSSGPVGSRGTC
jgi:alpha-glucoside transport system permease protein